jgi:hypothetical protein
MRKMLGMPPFCDSQADLARGAARARGASRGLRAAIGRGECVGALHSPGISGSVQAGRVGRGFASPTEGRANRRRILVGLTAFAPPYALARLRRGRRNSSRASGTRVRSRFRPPHVENVGLLSIRASGTILVEARRLAPPRPPRPAQVARRGRLGVTNLGNARLPTRGHVPRPFHNRASPDYGLPLVLDAALLQPGPGSHHQRGTQVCPPSGATRAAGGGPRANCLHPAASGGPSASGRRATVGRPGPPGALGGGHGGRLDRLVGAPAPRSAPKRRIVGVTP